MLGEVAGYQDEVPAVESLGVADATQDVVVVEAVKHEFDDDARIGRVGAACDEIHALGEGAGGAHLACNLGDFDADLFTDEFVRGSIVDRKSTRLNSSHVSISYAVFCLKKKIRSLY